MQTLSDDFILINHSLKENLFKNPKDYIIINKEQKYAYINENSGSQPQFISLDYKLKNDNRDNFILKDNISDEILLKYLNYNITKRLSVKFDEFFQLLRVAKQFNDNNIIVEIETKFQRKKILNPENVSLFLLEIILQDNDNLNELEMNLLYSKCNENSNYILEIIISYFNDQKSSEVVDNLLKILEAKKDYITVPKFEFLLFILNKINHIDSNIKRKVINIFFKSQNCNAEIKKKLIMISILDFTNFNDKIFTECFDFSEFIENSIFTNENKNFFSEQEENFIRLIYKKANLQCKNANVKVPTEQNETEKNEDQANLLHIDLKFKEEKIISTGGSIQCMAKTNLPNLKCKLIAFGQQDGIIKLLEVSKEGCEIISSYKGHTLGIKCLLYVDEDIPVFISGSIDKTIKIWHIQENYCIDTFMGHTDGVLCMIYLGQSILISGSMDCTIKVWDYLHGICSKTIIGHERSVQCLVDMKQIGENIIASGSSDTSIRVWNIKTGMQLKFFNEHVQTVQCIVYPYHYKNNILVSGSLDTTIRLWNIKTGELDKKLSGHNDFVTAIVSLHDINKRLILSGGWDKHFNLWDIETGHCLHSFNIGYGITRGASCMMTYSPDFYNMNNILVLGNFDGTIKLLIIKINN